MREGGAFYHVTSVKVACPAVTEICVKTGFSSFSEYALHVNCSTLLDPSREKAPISHAQISSDLAMMEKTFFPLLDDAHDIYGLDKLINGDVNPFFRQEARANVDIPHCLMIARLAGNPNFEALIPECEEAYSAYMGKERFLAWSQRWLNFLTYLREEIDPGTFWVEYARVNEEKRGIEVARLAKLQAAHPTITHEELMDLANQWPDPTTGLTWQRWCIGHEWQNGEVSQCVVVK